MKCVFILLLMLSGLVYASTEKDLIETDWDIYNDVEIREYFRTIDNQRRQDILTTLQATKLSLIKGNVVGTISKLEQLLTIYRDKPISIIVKRYLAIANFSIGGFKKVLTYLEDPKFNSYQYYKNICLIKILSLVHLGYTEALAYNFKRCKKENNSLVEDKFAWLNILESSIKPKFREPFFIRNEKLRKLVLSLKGNDQIETWLKYGLMYDKENLIISSLSILPESMFSSDIQRTLLAYNYFNNGNSKSARLFVEDLNNSNSNYLKAVIEVKNKDHKTAYAHLLAALSRREFSINSNQLMIYVAWLTKNWEWGRKSLNTLTAPSILKREQKLINATFLLNQGHLKRAAHELELLKIEYNKKFPYEALIIESYILFNLKRKNWINSSDDVCLRYDGMNCWLHLQAHIWDDYSENFSNLPKTKKYKTVERLRVLTSFKEKKVIDEAIFINQKDIIELDSIKDPSLTDKNKY